MNRFILAFALAFGLAAGASAQSNTAVVNQLGDDSDSQIEQDGTNNEARTLQVTDGTSSSVRNSATIEQNGSDHNAAGSEIVTLVDGFTGGAASAFLSQFGDAAQAPGIVQVGEGNVDKIDQDGIRQSALVISLGIENEATVTQSNGFNVAASVAYGDDNTTTIEQTGSSASLLGLFSNAAAAGTYGDDNKTTITQENGDGNIAAVGVGLNLDGTSLGDLLQESFENTVDILQDGSGNLALVGVAGSSNIVDVDQMSNGNQAFAVQDGTMNVSNITQD